MLKRLDSIAARLKDLQSEIVDLRNDIVNRELMPEQSSAVIIGKKIAHYRKNADLSQLDLATALNMLLDEIQDVESGHKRLYADQIAALAYLLNVNPLDLLYGKE